MDATGNKLSHFDDNEFLWEKPLLVLDAVFRPEIDTPFSPTVFERLEMGRSVKNPIPLDNEKDKEKSPPTVPLFDRLNRSPTLLWSQILER